MSLLEAVVHLQKIMLILEEVVFAAGFSDVYQMIRNQSAVDVLVSKVFACADVHASIYLSGVGADDFSSDSLSYCCGELCLTAGCRSQYGQHVRLHSSVSLFMSVIELTCKFRKKLPIKCLWG